MPLILFKTEENIVYEILDKKKVYCNMKKLFSIKYFLTSKKVKNAYFVQFLRKKNVYSVYFLLFNQNIEINRKLLKNYFWCKIIYFFSKRDGFL